MKEKEPITSSMMGTLCGWLVIKSSLLPEGKVLVINPTMFPFTEAPIPKIDSPYRTDYINLRINPDKIKTCKSD